MGEGDGVVSEHTRRDVGGGNIVNTGGGAHVLCHCVTIMSMCAQVSGVHGGCCERGHSLCAYIYACDMC